MLDANILILLMNNANCSDPWCPMLNNKQHNTMHVREEVGVPMRLCITGMLQMWVTLLYPVSDRCIKMRDIFGALILDPLNSLCPDNKSLELSQNFYCSWLNPDKCAGFYNCIVQEFLVNYPNPWISGSEAWFIGNNTNSKTLLYNVQVVSFAWNEFLNTNVYKLHVCVCHFCRIIMLRASRRLRNYILKFKQSLRSFAKYDKQG